MKKKKFLMCVISIIALVVSSMAMAFSASATGAQNGKLSIKDTATAQSIMLTHKNQHSKDGVVLEFDMLTAPTLIDTPEGGTNSIRFFAGMPKDEFSTLNTLGGTGIIGAGLQIDVATNKLTYYPNGLCWGAAATSTGTAQNALTAVDTWNWTFATSPFKANTKYRITYNFEAKDFTDSVTMESSAIGSNEYTTFLTVAKYVDPFTGAEDKRTGAINETSSGYAGIILEDINVDIDNFVVKDKSGALLCSEGFNGAIATDSPAGKVALGGGSTISAYDRKGAYGMFATGQDDNSSPKIVLSDAIVTAGTAGIDSIGGDILLTQSEKLICDTFSKGFTPYEYIASIIDKTQISGADEINITTGFETATQLAVTYYKNGAIVSGINKGDSGDYAVNYCYTDAAGNKAYATLNVKASPVEIRFDISGKVTSCGVAVSGSTITYGEGLSVVTNETGDYTFSVVSNSTVTLSVSSNDYRAQSFTITSIKENTTHNFEVVPINTLLFAPSDTALATVSHSKQHGENGVIIEFDLLEPAKCTGQVYVGLSFFAGLSSNTVSSNLIDSEISNDSGIMFEINRNQTGLQYLPLVYGSYEEELGETRDVVVKGATTQTLAKTAPNKGIANSVLSAAPFASAQSFRATFDFVKQTFVLESKAIGAVGEYAELVEISNIKNTGAGYSGINFGNVGALIDNVKFSELSGAVIAENSFEASLSDKSEALDYGGIILSAISSTITEGDTTYLPIKNTYIAGGNTVIDCVGAQIELNTNKVQFNIEGVFNKFSYITSVVDIADAINATSGFDTLANLTVKIYKDGATQDAITTSGDYTVNYCYIDTDGNKSYANLAVQAYAKTIVSLMIDGNYETKIELGGTFKVDGLQLVVEYNVGEAERVPLTLDMLTIDTQSLGDKFLSITYNGYTQENYDRITIVKRLLTVSGKVTFNGAGVAGAVVSGGTDLSATTAQDGSYTLKVSEGSAVTLTATKEHFVKLSKNITVNENKELNFELAKVQVSVSGTVKLGGSVQAGVKVFYNTTDFVLTDASGKYTIEVDYGSNVTLRVEADGYQAFSQELTNVTANQTKDIAVAVAEKDKGCKSALTADISIAMFALCVILASGLLILRRKKTF